MGSKHPDAKKYRFGQVAILAIHSRTIYFCKGQLDFEMHKLLLVIVLKIAQSQSALKIIGKSRFLSMLLKYMEPQPNPARLWTMAQYEELQLQVRL